MLCKARMALSRPAPGPFTKPEFCAIRDHVLRDRNLQQLLVQRKACSFLEPRKPIFPALDHEITWPLLLVNEMMMLLKDEWMWT